MPLCGLELVQPQCDHAIHETLCRVTSSEAKDAQHAEGLGLHHARTRTQQRNTLALHSRRYMPVASDDHDVSTLESTASSHIATALTLQRARDAHMGEHLLRKVNKATIKLFGLIGFAILEVRHQCFATRLQTGLQRSVPQPEA